MKNQSKVLISLVLLPFTFGPGHKVYAQGVPSNFNDYLKMHKAETRNPNSFRMLTSAQPTEQESTKILQDPLIMLPASPVQREHVAPLIKLALQIQNNQTQIRGVSVNTDCYASLGTSFQIQYNQILQGITNDTYENKDDYLKALPTLTKDWSEDEKKCLMATNISDFEANYTSADLFKNMTGTEIYDNYQDNLSTGVCVHLHHMGALIGEALGFQCGTLATVWQDTTGRANHAVTVCKDPATDSYFMANYGKLFELDGAIFTEALDSINNIIGPMNTQGSVISCFGKSESMTDNCVHEYIPASTRWSLYAIARGMEGIEKDGTAPLDLEITNSGLNFSLRAVQQSKSDKTTKRGSVISRERGHGLVGVYSGYGGYHFASLGFGAQQSTQNTQGNSSLASFYLGSYYYRQPNALVGLYEDTQTQNVQGLITLSHLEQNLALGSPNTTIGGSIDLGASVDGSFSTGGVTDQLAINARQRVGKLFAIRVEHVGVINGDVQANQMGAHFERTTVSFDSNVDTKNKNLTWNNSLEGHLLYSGYKPSTAAMEIQGEVAAILDIFGKDELLSMGIDYNLGYTFASQDPYYSDAKGNDLIFYEIQYEATVRPTQRTKFILYAELASSDMSPWFGDKALIIDPKITPYRRTPGLEAGLRLEVELGKKKRKNTH